jgi:Right handed beta helix region
MERILIVLVACGLSAAPAQAGPNRTWVSGHGTDSGACTREAPCRTFAFAIIQTNAGGEIDVLDPAGYGPVTINKAIGIVNDGAGPAATEVGSGGTGVTINAGASDSVHLRGLTIEGSSSNGTGILFATGGSLAIENCVVRGFGSGIDFQANQGTAVTGVLRNVITNNNGVGIGVGDAMSLESLNVTIVDSEASNNRSGIVASSGGNTAVMVRNSVASNNGTGLFAQFATLRVAHSVVTGNALGLNIGTEGTIDSYGDNDIDGDANNDTGVLTVIPTH